MRSLNRDKKQVLVLWGGPDAERPVSIMSGRAVAQALRDDGRFLVCGREIDRPDAAGMVAMVEEAGADAVFPVLHGQWGEGGGLQVLLEEVGVPYVGSQPDAALQSMDKSATKLRARELGIATPDWQELGPEEVCEVAPPLVLKPIDDGSSVDLRVCRNVVDLTAARNELHPKRGRLLAEAYIAGREVTVGILVDRALPVIEIVPGEAVEFYDYSAKYERDDTQYLVDPALPPGIGERCREQALQLFRGLGCRDLARVDFMLDESGLWLLELNTMPGFTDHSLVPMAARRLGVEMPELCAELAETALNRARIDLRAGSPA